MQRLRNTASLWTAAALILSAALYNRYPLTFWDTRYYVEHASSLLPRPDRLIGYSVLIRLFCMRFSLWPMVIVQALLVAALVRRTVVALHGSQGHARYLALVFALTVATAMPWIAGQLMADIFTPLLVLALFSVTLAPAPTLVARYALLGLLVVCASVHLTHLTLGLALLVVIAGLLRAAREASIGRRVLPPAVALLLGVLAMLGLSYAKTGRATLAAGSNAFLLGHFVESGIAGRMLNEHCPERGYLLCPHRHALPMTPDEFLWQDKLDLSPWENPEPIKREALRLLRDSLREHFALHVRIAVTYTLRTLGRFRTGEGLDNHAVELVEPQIARYAPRDIPAYRAARQQHAALPIDLLRSVHTPVGVALLAVAAIMVGWRLRRGPGALHDPSVRFVLFVLAALLINAALSGNIAGVYDRYQARLMWLLMIGVWGFLGPKSALSLSR